jgi:hypothetical protein
LDHANLNAKRTSNYGEKIIIKFEPISASLLTKIAPNVMPYVDKATSKLNVELYKALYGALRLASAPG